MTAALKYGTTDFAGAPALLGVERSARGYRWVERLDPSRALAATAIAQTHGLPELLGRVLAARGAEPQSAALFLDPALKTLLPDPSRLADMEKAANRFAAAVRAKEAVALFADYDVDGAACAALIERFMRAHGLTPLTYIPDRLTEGYGPSPGALAGLAQQGARVILTLDCGTTSDAAIAAANESGADVIVIDHHQADEALPPAYAVVNPNRQDDLSGQGHLAAAGVVFLFLVAVTRALRRDGAYLRQPEPDLLRLLDLVALATICDVVPLKEVNRAFVAQGLKVLRLRHNQGLRALADAARVESAPNGYTLGFILGPRINAGGRIGASSLGAKLLACDDEVEARSLAAKLEALNAKRKAVEEDMLAEAFALAEDLLAADADRPLLFLAQDGWHKGLLGLIAGRVAERFRLPAFVAVPETGGTATGSARSIAGVDLGAAIRAAVHQGLLLKGGGHAMAAGFKLEQTRQEAFVAFLSRQLSGRVAKAVSARTLPIDGALSAKGANLDLMALLARAGPYGTGHPEPRFVFPAHRLTRVRAIKDQHLRCTLVAPDGARLEACAFRVADAPLGRMLLQGEGLPFHVAGHLRLSSWQGRDNVELLIEDAADPRRDA